MKGKKDKTYSLYFRIRPHIFTYKKSLYYVYYTFSSIQEESEVYVFTKYKVEETVAARSGRCIKTGEQLTGVARRFPELEIIMNV